MTIPVSPLKPLDGFSLHLKSSEHAWPCPKWPSASPGLSSSLPSCQPPFWWPNPTHGLLNPIELILGSQVHQAPVSETGIHTCSSRGTHTHTKWHPSTCPSELNLENSSSGKQTLMLPGNWPGDRLVCLRKCYEYLHTHLPAQQTHWAWALCSVALVSLTPSPGPLTE